MPTLTIDQALERYGRYCGPVNKRKVLSALRQYLEWGGRADDENLAAYLKHLQEQGYRPATVDLRRRQIRAFWRTLGVTPPRAVLDFHPEQDSERPALDKDLVLHLIQSRDDYSAYLRALLVLGTLYGPRAIELSRVQAQDVDLNASRWYCRTAKKGHPRWLWIPPAVRDELDIRWPKVSVGHVEKRFEELWILAGFDDRPDHVGWHALRRALTSELAANGVPDGSIAQFMRWASGGPGGHAMVALYKSRSHTVGMGGTEATPRGLAGSYADDPEVWDRHPFLPSWS